jgi:erythromycin esterase-like protein
MSSTLGDSLDSVTAATAIGVIYRPHTERGSHYFDACLAEQFDAVIHLDHTRAVEPLERTSRWDRGEPRETFPSGI